MLLPVCMSVNLGVSYQWKVVDLRRLKTGRLREYSGGGSKGAWTKLHNKEVRS
jgi:hypothetical protein